MKMDKLKAMVINNWKIMIMGICLFILGIIIGTSGTKSIADYNKLQADCGGLKGQLIKVKAEKEKETNEKERLEEKLKEAEPFFKMSYEEKSKLDTEARKKQEERIAKEKQETENKKKADLEARTITLSNGNFVSGKDFNSGRYNVVAVDGNGNVSSDNMFNGGINAIMGIGNNTLGNDFYQKEYKNIDLPKDVTISISDVTIKLIPVE